MAVWLLNLCAFTLDIRGNSMPNTCSFDISYFMHRLCCITPRAIQHTEYTLYDGIRVSCKLGLKKILAMVESIGYFQKSTHAIYTCFERAKSLDALKPN